MSGDRATVLLPGDGRQLALGAALQLCFKADDSEVDGRYSISVATVGPDHAGTTPHVHREHDDVSFVVEGALAFDVSGQIFEAPAGAFVLVPRGLAHRWWNPRSEPAVFLNIHVPGSGFERFVRELADLSSAGRASPAAMAELGARFDVWFDEDDLGARYAAEGAAGTREATAGLRSADPVAFVPTTDAVRARAFYEDVLGLPLVADDGFALVFDMAGTMLRITRVATLEPQPFTVLGWRVDDVAGAARALAACGVALERYPHLEQDELGVWTSPGNTRVAWFKDPDGNTLSLTELPSRA